MAAERDHAAHRAKPRAQPPRTGYGNGLIVAALPDVYSTPWVRDMAGRRWRSPAWATGARRAPRSSLISMRGPTGKMRAEVNGADYQISVVRYFGDGAEEPFFTQEGSTNIEFDNWGEVLWALGEYLRKYDDPALLKAATYRGPLYESARDFIVKPLHRQYGAIRRRADRRRRHVDLGGAAEGQEAFRFLDRDGDRRPARIRRRRAARRR